MFVESSKAFNTLSKILLWTKPSYFSARFVTATPGACINKTGLFSLAAAVVPQSKSTESCSSAAVVSHKVNLSSCVVAGQPSSVPRKENLLSSVVDRRLLCHKVNLPRCEARRRHFIMTCDQN